ncbi:MAG: DUF4123 domain-containing protein [Bacteroidales bacterium]|nr:DUF4123 domain-containing protein [Bacteroidales bacterium]
MAKITLTPLPKEDPEEKLSEGKIRKLEPSKIEVDESKQVSVTEFLLERAEKEECHLFGIVDSARNDEVFRYLVTGDVQYKSLFEDTMDVQSYGVSGFLVECKKESPLFRWMTTEAWGDSCCIYFTSKSSFDDLFSHFRKFNRVYLEGDDVVLFRFYDPRVLQTYLPTCNRVEIETFFGEVNSFFTESDKQEVIHVFKQDIADNENLLLVSSFKLTTE